MRNFLQPLDFGRGSGNSNRACFRILKVSYARWRRAAGRSAALRERGGQTGVPLRTVVAIHLAAPAPAPRPSLRPPMEKPSACCIPASSAWKAARIFATPVLQIGGDAPCSGDVEIDLHTSGWRAHGHDRNPAFQNVILHVLWDESAAPSAAPPVSAVERVSRYAPGGTDPVARKYFPAHAAGGNARKNVAAPLRALEQDKLETLLRDAAQVRLQSKAAQFLARARQAGWEQAMWGGIISRARLQTQCLANAKSGRNAFALAGGGGHRLCPASAPDGDRWFAAG